ncbi:MAG: hypothetical protein JSS82_03605 [Bacteroidetes bacterium]|nr:hypothetical protein [Bacteroidota bacterium]
MGKMFMGRESTFYYASSQRSESELLDDANLSKPVMAYDSRVAYCNVLQKGAMHTGIVVTNHSARINSLIRNHLENNPAITVAEFFRSPMYTHAMVHGQTETLGLLRAAAPNNAATGGKGVFTTRLGFECTAPKHMAPMYYIRQISDGEGGCHYEIHLNNFGSVDGMYNSSTMSKLGMHNTDVSVGYIIDNGVQHGFLVYPDRSASMKMLANNADRSDFQQLRTYSVPHWSSSHPERSDCVLSVGLPTQGMFCDEDCTEQISPDRMCGFGLRCPHQKNLPFMFDDNSIDVDEKTRMYSALIRTYFSTFPHSTHINCVIIVVDGVNPSSCDLDVIATLKYQPPNITISMDNAKAVHQLTQLATLVALNDHHRGKKVHSKDEKGFLGISKIKFAGDRFIVNHSWLKKKFQKYRKELTQKDCAVPKNQYAYDVAMHYLESNETANMAAILGSCDE